MPLDLTNEAVILYDSNGVELNVANGVAIPVGTSGLVLMGADVGGIARQLRTDTSGILQTVGSVTTAITGPLVADGADQVATSDQETIGLLQQVLTELRKVSAQLAHMTGIDIKDTDVD